MMKSIRHLVQVTSLTILLSLSGCSLFESVGEDRIWENPDPYLAQGMDFKIAGLPSYVKEKDVYEISSEMELAVLAAILYHQDDLELHYTSIEPISLDRLFAYLESIIPISFRLTMGELTYTRSDDVVLILYSLEIDPVLTDYDNVDRLARSWAVEVTDPLLPGPENIRAIHDRLVLYTQYDTSLLDIDLTKVGSHVSFEALGLFENRTAVCSGYARAFNAMARNADIPSLMISSVSMQHAWNLVFDGSEWVYLDATFDDPVPDVSGKVRYTYFLIDEARLRSDGKHDFDRSTDETLSARDYLEFARYVFPDSVENGVN